MELPFKHNYNGSGEPSDDEGGFSGGVEHDEHDGTDKESSSTKRQPSDAIRHIPLDVAGDEGVFHVRRRPQVEHALPLRNLLTPESSLADKPKAIPEMPVQKLEIPAPAHAQPEVRAGHVEPAPQLQERALDVAATQAVVRPNISVLQRDLNSINKAPAVNPNLVATAPSPARFESAPSGPNAPTTAEQTAQSEHHPTPNASQFNTLKQPQPKEALVVANAAVEAALIDAMEKPDEIKEIQSAWHTIKVNERTGQVVEQTQGRAFAEEQRAEKQPAAQTDQRKKSRSRSSDSSVVTGVAHLLAGALDPSSGKLKIALPSGIPKNLDAQHLLTAGKKHAVASFNSAWLWLIVGLLVIIWFGRSLF